MQLLVCTTGRVARCFRWFIAFWGFKHFCRILESGHEIVEDSNLHIHCPLPLSLTQLTWTVCSLSLLKVHSVVQPPRVLSIADPIFFVWDYSTVLFVPP